MAKDLILHYDEKVQALEAQIERLRAAISWMADQDPQLVDAAHDKFKIVYE